MKLTDMEYLGNMELLNLPKTAFLASNTILPDMVLKCYDWAATNHEGCVISGFNSKMEKDVFHFLVKGKQHIILVLARQMYKKIPQELLSLIDDNYLLIISVSNAVRQSRTTALARNKYICEIADHIIFVGVNEKSSLFELKSAYSEKEESILKEQILSIDK